MELDIQNTLNEYGNISGKYKELGLNLVQALKIFLDEEEIRYLTVDYRVKDENSFIEKIERKNYSEPFEEIEDICGIRIICYYKSDIGKICKIINQQFEIVESQDKEELLEPDQFGYRSYHFIVKIKNEWLCAPNYKSLSNLKAEIQIRTNLMHTWAEIEHKLEYKKEEDIPKQFKRRFSLLSAKLEEADEQFEQLKNDIIKYRNSYREKILDTSNNNVKLAKDDVEINLDNLQAFLDYYFPKKSKNIKTISRLVGELNKHKISILELTDIYNKCHDIIPQLEKEVGCLRNAKVKFSQAGAVRYMLMITIDGYYTPGIHPKDVKEVIERHKLY